MIITWIDHHLCPSSARNSSIHLDTVTLDILLSASTRLCPLCSSIMASQRSTMNCALEAHSVCVCTFSAFTPSRNISISSKHRTELVCTAVSQIIARACQAFSLLTSPQGLKRLLRGLRLYVIPPVKVIGFSRRVTAPSDNHEHQFELFITPLKLSWSLFFHFLASLSGSLFFLSLTGYTRDFRSFCFPLQYHL